MIRTQTKGREAERKSRAPWLSRHLSTLFVSPATAVLLSVGWLALPIGGSSMAALAGPAEQEILVAKGQEMVFPIDERVLAPPYIKR